MTALETLELQPGATIEDAQKSFYRLSKKFHPDKNPNDNDSERKFKEVVKAYQIIKEDPRLLNPTVPTSTPSFGFLQVIINATVDDYFFYRERTIKYPRKILCKTCKGTGSSDPINGKCPQCNGEGNIESSILQMMGRGSQCPHCKGTGVRDELYCKKCNGTRYEQEFTSYQMRFDPRIYHKKSILIKRGGDQNKDGSFGDAYAKINVKEDTYVKVEEDGCFSICESVLPIQKIIGDECETEIYGVKFKYIIRKGETEYYIQDRAAGYPRTIRVRFIERQPAIDKDTKELYEKILEIEKPQLNKYRQDRKRGSP